MRYVRVPLRWNKPQGIFGRSACVQFETYVPFGKQIMEVATV